MTELGTICRFTPNKESRVRVVAWSQKKATSRGSVLNQSSTNFFSTVYFNRSFDFWRYLYFLKTFRKSIRRIEPRPPLYRWGYLVEFVAECSLSPKTSETDWLKFLLNRWIDNSEAAICSSSRIVALSTLSRRFDGKTFWANRAKHMTDSWIWIYWPENFQFPLLVLQMPQSLDGLVGFVNSSL